LTEPFHYDDNDSNFPGRRANPCGFFALLIAIPAAGCNSSPSGKLRNFRIGCQKWSVLSLLKIKGNLEPRLQQLGVHAVWTEFPSGPPMLDAMNSGSIQSGQTGDSPPLFARVAGVPIVYVGASTPSPTSSALLVPADSSVRTVAGWKGRKIGFTKGTRAHALVLRALAKEKLTFKDVEAVYLAPSDARAAMEGGAIDAWAVWDPFLATAEHQGGARVLVDGTEEGKGQRSFSKRTLTPSLPPDNRVAAAVG
jgi:sulfonate transport system substrate-binding protein